MLRVSRAQWLWSGIAIASVALTSGLTVLLLPYLYPANLALFYAAVALNTRFGGGAAGLLTAILSTLFIFYWFVPAGNVLSLVPLAVFLLVTLLIHSLNLQLKNAKWRVTANLRVLAASEERYRVLAEQVPQLIWITDAKGAVEYFNQQWYIYTGLTPETSLGEGWQIAVHPHDRADVLEEWRSTAAVGNPVEMQYRLLQADGTYRWHMVRATALRAADGSIAQWFGSCTDIDDQKQIDQERSRLLAELESKQRLLEAVLQQMPAGLIVAEAPSGRVVLTNDLAQQIVFGDRPTAQAIEDYLKVPYQILHLDGQPYTCENLPLSRSLQGETVIQEEAIVVNSNGSAKIILIDASPIRNEAGEILAAVLTFYDVTERKQAEAALREAEERIRLATAAADLGMWFWDLLADEIVWTDKSKALFGMEPHQGITYDEFISRLHPEDRSPTHAAVNRALEERIEYNVEYRAVWADHSVHWIAARGRGIYDDEGNAIRMMGTVQDISERKRIAADRQQAEDALRASEARFRQIAEHIQDVFWVSNPWRQEIFYVSPAYEQVWGRSCQSLYDNPGSFIETLHPADRDRVAKTFFEQIQDGKSDNEYRIIHADGSIRWIHDRGFVIEPEADGTWRVAGVAEDITHRRQTEDALRNALTKLDFHVENTPLAVIEWNREMEILRWSKAAERVFGWTAAERLGTNLTDWQFVYEADVEDVGTVVGSLYRGDTRQTSSQNRNYTKDGSIVYCQWYNSALLDEAGNLVSMLSLVLDVTERERIEADRQRAEQNLQQSEARFRMIADSAPVFIWMADPRGKNTYCNQPWLDFVGQTYEEALAIGWLPGIHPDDRQRCAEAFAHALSQQQPLSFEYRYRRADGEYRWLLDKSVPLFTPKGEYAGQIGSGVDITEAKRDEVVRKAAAAEREQLLIREQTARESAESANRIKDEFLAVLSHELRSPLNPILGWTRLLRSRKFDAAKTDQALETIERNAKLQTQLIEDLLDVSRILRGKLSFNISPVNLNTTIAAAMETVRLSAEAKAIDLQLVNPQNLIVSGDSNRLQQVVWNLLANAIKFTPPGGRVEVRLEAVTAGAAFAQITVTDTGKGINPDFLPHVFDYFRQADSSTTRTFGGLGLGLAIVRHLVELHGGTVWAESLGEAQGATFTVRLPLLKESDKPADLPDLPLPSSAQPLANVRILAVDDEPDMRDYIAFVLESSGANVTIAASADEALAVFMQVQPDILISDIGMPHKDGYILLHQIRSLEASHNSFAQGTPAIALTAYAGEYNQQQALAAGFQLHIAKPIEPDELTDAIGQLLAESRIREKL